MVLKRLAEGFDPHEIAAELNCSKKTVEYHRQEVFDRLADLGVRQGRIADLTQYAIANDLIEPNLFGEEMRLTFAQAKKLCGLPAEFELKRQEDFERAIAAWKEKTVAARNGDRDNEAADLSQCKELFKKRWSARQSRICPRCGDFKSAHAVHCGTCARAEKNHHNEMNETTVELKQHELELGTILVPPRATKSGPLTTVMQKLALEGQIGDSFVTCKPPTSVSAVARSLGLSVITRTANPEVKDKSKRLYRIWRCDGLDMEAVNQIIRKRLAGEPVPPPKPCVPLPPDPNKHKKKH